MARAGVCPHPDIAAILAELARRGETVSLCFSADQLQAAHADYLLVDASAVWALAAARALALPAIAYHPGLASLEKRLDFNLVLLSRALQPGADRFDESYRFVGRCRSERAAEDRFAWHGWGPDPLIYLSPGEIARACEAALGGPPFRLLVDAAQLPRGELLERATLAIVEADAGLVEDCARAGVPLLVYPRNADQAPLAGLVQELGAGVRLSEADLESGRLRYLAGRVMADPKYCRAAEALRETVLQSGRAAQACDEILAYRLRR